MDLLILNWISLDICYFWFQANSCINKSSFSIIKEDS